MTRKVAESTASRRKNIRCCLGNFTVKHAFARFQARACHSVWIDIAHGAGARADFPPNQCARKFDPVAVGAGHLEGIEQQIIRGDFALRWHFEKGLRFAVAATQNDVHHARACSTREKAFDRWSHDFGFGFSRLVGLEECVEAIKDDIHTVGEAFALLFTFYIPRYVNEKIDSDVYESIMMLQF